MAAVSAALPRLQLLALSGPPLARLPALDRTIHIGRALGSDLLLPDPAVSRQHALLTPHGDRLLLRDLGGSAGMRVNGQPLPSAGARALLAGDRLRIGPWQFEIAAVEPAGIATELESEGELATEVQVLAEPQPHSDIADYARFAADAAACTSLAALDACLLAEVRRQASLDAAIMLVPGNGNRVRIVASDPADARPAGLTRRLLDLADAGGVLMLESAARVDAEQTQVGLLPAWSICVALRGDAHSDAWVHGWRQTASAPGPKLGNYLRGLAELAQALRSGLLQRAAAERHARLEIDLAEAQRVQRRLLPIERGTLGDLQHASLFRPGRTVSGDLLLLMADARGGCVFAIGDVSGSGAGAGLLMAQLCGLLQAALPAADGIVAAATLLNRSLLQVGEGRFATAVLGRYDAGSETLELVDAGHGMTFLAAPGRPLAALELPGGPPLGVVEEPYRSVRVPFVPGARLLLLSDGIAELRDAHGKVLGALGAAEAIDAVPADGVNALTVALDAWTDPAAVPDDASALLLWRQPAGASSASFA